jgi:hypothetical protein
LISVNGVFNMPSKPKARKTTNSPDDLWIAPRRAPASPSPPQIFVPSTVGLTSKYLEFADIALGTKKPQPRKRKAGSGAGHGRHEKKSAAREISIDSISLPKRGFGAFRNLR